MTRTTSLLFLFISFRVQIIYDSCIVSCCFAKVHDHRHPASPFPSDKNGNRRRRGIDCMLFAGKSSQTTNETSSCHLTSCVDQLDLRAAKIFSSCLLQTFLSLRSPFLPLTLHDKCTDIVVECRKGLLINREPPKISPQLWLHGILSVVSSRPALARQVMLKLKPNHL